MNTISEQWLQNYLTTSVLPLLQQCMQSTVQIKQHSESVNEDLMTLIKNNYTATSSRIDNMIESICYMRKSCDEKAGKILQIMEDRRYVYITEISKVLFNPPLNCLNSYGRSL